MLAEETPPIDRQSRGVGFRRSVDLRELMRESALDILAVFVLAQLGLIVFALVDPNRLPYLSQANISVQLESIPILGVIALGVGVLMIAGEFDLSVGANYTFTSIVMASLATRGMSPFVAVLIAIAIGAGIGLTNAFVTLRFHLPSFIVTLGAMLFWEGFTLFYHGASAQLFSPGATFTAIFSGSIGFIAAAFIWFVGAAALFWALLHHHRFGNHVFAVGGNKRAAAAIGVSPARVKTIAFVLAGMCAAFAGVLAATRVNSIQPGQGSGLELQAIAACVIGGVSLTGGTGTILGIFLGASLIYTIQDVLLLSGAPSFYLNIFVGLLIVIAAMFNQITHRREAV